MLLDIPPCLECPTDDGITWMDRPINLVVMLHTMCDVTRWCYYYLLILTEGEKMPLQMDGNMILVPRLDSTATVKITPWKWPWIDPTKM